MILPFPEKFDENEWMLIVTIIGGVLLYKFLPKRFPHSMAFLIMVFSSFYSRTVDHVLASPFLDFYDVMDNPKYEFFGVFTYFMYAPFAYIFIYFFDKYNLKGMKAALYILGFSLFGTGFEWISTKLHIFTLKEWKTAYSFTVYLFVQYCTVLFFLYLKRIYRLPKTSE
jgi:apolipoprotein N-acyltransferase